MHRTASTVALLAGCLGILVACGDDTGGGGGSGGSTAATGGGTATTTTTDASSTASGTGGEDQGGGGGICTSFQLPEGDVACEQNSDCCVVVNGCTAESVVVSAADADVGSTWNECSDANECVDCVATYVEVLCEEGLCVGYAEEPGAGGRDPIDHCGVDTPDVPATDPGTAFSCGGAVE